MLIVNQVAPMFKGNNADTTPPPKKMAALTSNGRGVGDIFRADILEKILYGLRWYLNICSKYIDFLFQYTAPITVQYQVQYKMTQEMTL